MKLLIISDIHGKIEGMEKIFQIEKDFDALICNGDFIDMYALPEGFSEMYVTDMILQKLLLCRKPLLCIPGNHDIPELIEFFEEAGCNLHGKTKKLGNLTFAGYGGASTPFNTNYEPTELEIKSALGGFAKTTKNLVLVVHMPPRDTKLDRVGEKHVGSQAVREFIERTKPILVISAHIHENGGVDKINNTTLFYPGPFFEGKYGTVSITESGVECKLKEIKTEKTNSSPL